MCEDERWCNACAAYVCLLPWWGSMCCASGCCGPGTARQQWQEWEDAALFRPDAARPWWRGGADADADAPVALPPLAVPAAPAAAVALRV